MTEIEVLEKRIKEHQTAYYAGTPTIADDEYDALVDRLALLAPQSAALQAIGTDVFGTCEHIMPMGSQNKAADEAAFADWQSRHTDPLFVEYKLDGASLELQYTNGVLTAAVTRGDGKKGVNILENARLMYGVPNRIPDDFGIIAVRGEVLIDHSTFKKYPEAKNCRNLAVGLMKKQDGSARDLTFIAYDMRQDPGILNPISTCEETLQFLNNAGFMVPPGRICLTADEVNNLRKETIECRSTFPYDIDGLVVKMNQKDWQDLNRSRPDTQIAYKFPLDTAVSILRKVEFSQSGATYTPVAIFDPVQLNGTTVQRASLANMDVMRSLDLLIGCAVVIQKSGEIIPQVISAYATGGHTEAIRPPITCASCGAPLIDGTFLRCSNNKSTCPAQASHQLLKWFDTLEVKGMGPAMAEGFIKRFKNLEGLYQAAYAEEPVSGTTNELKFFEAIRVKKDCTFPQFIAGLDLSGIGESTIEKLQAAGYDTLERLLTVDEEALSIPGIGEETIAALQEQLPEVLTTALSLQNFISCHSQLAVGAMTGEVIVFTGALETMKRSEAEKLVRGAGGTTKSSVVKGTTFLVTNDTTSGSNKNKKAAQLGVPIINEATFLAWAQGGARPS